MKTIFKTIQIGGKGTVRRKIKKKNIKRKKTVEENKLLLLINRFNNLKIEKIKKYNQYIYDFIHNSLKKFKRIHFYKKNKIKKIDLFITDNLLQLNENENKQSLFTMKFTTLKLYLSNEGIYNLIETYFDLWDNINKKEYLHNNTI